VLVLLLLCGPRSHPDDRAKAVANTNQLLKQLALDGDSRQRRALEEQQEERSRRSMWGQTEGPSGPAERRSSVSAGGEPERGEASVAEPPRGLEVTYGLWHWVNPEAICSCSTGFGEREI